MARIYAVGVGPGDPELLTRKAERIIRQAPVICAPTGQADDCQLCPLHCGTLLDRSRQEVIVQHLSDDERRGGAGRLLGRRPPNRGLAQIDARAAMSPSSPSAIRFSIPPSSTSTASSANVTPIFRSKWFRASPASMPRPLPPACPWLAGIRADRHPPGHL